MKTDTIVGIWQGAQKKKKETKEAIGQESIREGRKAFPGFKKKIDDAYAAMEGRLKEKERLRKAAMEKEDKEIRNGCLGSGWP